MNGIEEFLTEWKAIHHKCKKVVLSNKVSFCATAHNIFVYTENGEAEEERYTITFDMDDYEESYSLDDIVRIE